MQCDVCGDKCRYGYFEERKEGTIHVCANCLIAHQQHKIQSERIRNKKIIDMHKKGFSNTTIATYISRSPLVVARVIMRWEKEHENGNSENQ